MGSLSKLMQKLDELELPQNVQPSSSDEKATPDAETVSDETTATEPTEPVTDQPAGEAAAELPDATELTNSDEIITDALDTELSETATRDPETSNTKPAAWQPVNPEVGPDSNAPLPENGSESLIDVTDVEALLAEHGPENETDPSSEPAPESAPSDVSTEVAVSDPSVTEDPTSEQPPAAPDTEIDLFADDPDETEEQARLSVDELLEEVTPEQAEKQHSNLFTTSSAIDAETDPSEAVSTVTGSESRATDTVPADPEPAAAPPAPSGEGDEQTMPWDAAKVDPAVIAFHNRYAAMCEQYRSLRARLLSMNPSGAHQIITVTSSVPEEGKSVTTMNLAICLAEGSQQRVLVVDADFRRASVARMVNAKHSPGMAELILGQLQLEHVIQHTPYPNLKLISAGKLGAASYGELLASAQIPAVFEQLRKRFSYVLLDTPPVTTVSDVSMLAPLSDGALMVVEMGRTPEPTVQLAVRTLQTNNVNVLGCVLSRYRDQRKHYYDRYYDYYDRH